MRKITMVVMVLIISTGVVAIERVRSRIPPNIKNVKFAAVALDLEIRNINAPSNIRCTEPFLTVTVEVWNIGNKDYDPAQGQAVLYCDLHDADTNAAIRFFDLPMNLVIKKGQFQKWTVSSHRQQIYPSQARKAFNVAKFLQMMFCADEQGVTHDANWTNNYKESRKISTKCSDSGFLPVRY